MLGKLWEGIKSLAAMAMSPWQKAAASPRVHQWMRWLVHFLAVLVVVVLLTFLNNRWDLGRMLRTPAPFFRQIWLPLLFMLVYILAWLGWWLWRLLTAPVDEASDYPDVDEAWEEALRAINEAGIHLETTPLFLVLGRPMGTEEALFAAAKMKLTVNQAPRRPDSPLYLYANSDAIFVTCAGASLTGKLASLLAETIGPQANAPPLAESVGGRPSRKSRRLLGNAEQAALAAARFRNLCRRIRESRAPYCAVNGVLTLVPFASSDDDEDAQQAAAVCRRDMQVVREELKTHCPLYVVVCDMEAAEGFHEFLRLLPTELRDRPMGRDFPLQPDVDRGEIPSIVESGVRWINRDLIRAAVYKLLRADSLGGDSDAALLDNRMLYRFCEQMRRREDRLAHLVSRLATVDWAGPPMLAGCYFAATGRSADREQAFFSGILGSMVETQNAVAWTEAALQEDREFRKWTRSGYIGLTAAAAALIAVAWYIWFRT